MTTPQSARPWDAAGEKQKWSKAIEKVQPLQDEFESRVTTPFEGFSLMSRAQFDAGVALLQSDCFSSRAAFFAEVRRLIAEPTSPSRAIVSLEAYRDCQRRWLEMLIVQDEWEANNSLHATAATPGS
jgi:hypothetical protein